MLLTPPDLARTYDAYQSFRNLGSAVHGKLDAKTLVHRAQEVVTTAAQTRVLGHNVKSVGQYAHAAGLYAGSATSCIVKALDIFVGTGCNFSGAQAPLAQGVGQHLTEAVKRPCETGLLGLTNGIVAGLSAAFGATLGAAVGLTVGAIFLAFTRDKTQGFGAQLKTMVSGCAADGALAFGAASALWSGLLGSLLLTAALRVLTAAVRGVLVGAGYAGGFAVGLVAATVALSVAPRPTAPLLPV